MKFKLFLIGFSLIHFDAFSLLGIPVPWIGFLICIFSCASSRLMLFHTLSASFIFMIALLAMSTILSWNPIVPVNYIAYRIINLIGFFVIVNYIAQHSFTSKMSIFLERYVVRIGLITAIVSIFVFLLHVTGLGDLPRNRLGTGGFEQTIIFSFEGGGLANRALGTFREPSLLGMALVLPGIIAFKNRQWPSLFFLIISIYLSYSFGTISAIILGTFITILFCVNIRKLYIVLLAFGSFLLLSVNLSLKVFSDNIYSQRFDRISSSSLIETSRGYIYDNIDITSINWLIGDGIGNLSFRLAELLVTDRPVSLLNLFLSILSGGGAIALVMLLYWFIYPNLLVQRYRIHLVTREAFLLLLPLNVFFFLYLTSFEELHIWHAIILGLLLGRIEQIRCDTHQLSSVERSSKNLNHLKTSTSILNHNTLKCKQL